MSAFDKWYATPDVQNMWGHKVAKEMLAEAAWMAALSQLEGLADEWLEDQTHGGSSNFDCADELKARIKELRK